MCKVNSNDNSIPGSVVHTYDTLLRVCQRVVEVVRMVVRMICSRLDE